MLSNYLTTWNTIWIHPQKKMLSASSSTSVCSLILAKLEWLLSTLLHI